MSTNWANSISLTQMRIFLGKLFIHPIVLSMINSALLILAYSSLKETWFSSDNWTHHIHFAIELWEGYGTIILSFGIVLEERHSLKKIIGIPSPEGAVDEICHDYGVIFVVLGMLIELLAWLIKIPNEVLNTENIEAFFIHSAALLAVFVVLLQFVFQYRLLAAKFMKKQF